MRLTTILLACVITLTSLGASWDARLAPVSYTRAELVTKSWGLQKIAATDAWSLAKPQVRPVVSVVDTGVDFQHPALLGEVSNFGWNFVNNTSKPYDEHGHGTHVSGIIEAVTNGHVLILPVKFYSDWKSGKENLLNSIKAIDFAIDHGAKIINYSGGGPEFNEYELAAFKRAEKYGVLVIAAAGNERENTDLTKNRYYPASYGLSNMITVASLDEYDNLVDSSNWGLITVDVAAPGKEILSTLPNQQYGLMTGTSQATAFVTGVAALLLAQNPRLSPQDIKRVIESSVEKRPGLTYKIKSGGSVNAYSALLKLQTLKFTIGSKHFKIEKNNKPRRNRW